ncbi:S-adenosyl-L-methionine-dependent methyltransferase [Yamadazyma tenuis]|uniref:S-adenosyl-L-methionine-dependent methyltransferase n=1 Tax=Candida tenuis (strain ATCC 10573 / BCRC 21748 / CBS 615 / JCM 9827 / NBRC 10315 / NRRL Y-1498 / VKM Y-70) TaxID=590646 RepID=G3BDN7_CANTC|nr:S-adenosyl-L-methionine-dependent methyltransferase [Yamadazyma tenuis ATCC 10573]EGV60346.1 S-adenosyl-L-methionine-dependent methyltransferase [Yamadazyma tenuis ATCC 10573]WEJ94414.1 S-adenosyl-L-methionine-dependent methyltransferase [Yamadazyma tenuis]
MATYSKKDFNTKHYNDARPSYPPAFYETLMDYHGSSRDLAVDIGCGSGFVTFALTKYFKKVIGTDISEVMVEQCRADPRTQKSDKLEFYVGAAEETPSVIKENSVDLLTGAECCHWVDHPVFFKESWRILKPGGTLAFWFYKDPIFVDFPAANDIYDEFCYESPEYMGPQYEQPGRALLRTLMKEIDVPEDLYTDITRVEYEPLRDKTPNTLYIAKRINLAIFKEYVTSWSAYHNWMKAYPDKKDVADQFIDKLASTLGWDDDFEFTVVWATVYTFAKKKG